MPIPRRAGTGCEIVGSTISVKVGTTSADVARGDKLPGSTPIDSTGSTIGQQLVHDGGRFAPSGGGGTLQTTDGNVATAATYTPADGKAVTVRATVVARQSDGTKAAGYVRQATFRRAGGTTTQIGTTTTIGTDHEDTASWDATLDASGTAVRARVTGETAKTIDWTVRFEVVGAP